MNINFEKFKDFFYSNQKPIIRVLLDLVFLLFLTFILSRQYIATTYSLKIGDIAKNNIRAPKDIEYVLRKETNLLFDTRRKEVPPVFICDLKRMYMAEDEISSFFEAVEKFKQDYKYLNQDNIRNIIRLLPPKYKSKLKRNDLELIIRYSQLNMLKERAIKLLTTIYKAGIISENNILEEIIQRNGLEIHFENNRESYSNVVKRYNDIYIYEDLLRNIFWESKKIIPGLRYDKLQAITKLIRIYIRPNLKYDVKLTANKIEKELSRLKPVTDRIKKNSLVIRAGDRITDKQYQKLIEISKITNKTNFKAIIGVFLFLLLVNIFVILFLYYYNDRIILNLNDNILIFSLLFFAVLISYAITKIPFVYEPDIPMGIFMPLAFVSISIAFLIDKNVAIIFAFFTSVIVFIITKNDPPSMLITIFSSMAAIYSTKNITKRSDLWRTGIYIIIALLMFMLSWSFLFDYSIKILFKLCLYSMFHGIVIVLLTLGILPIYENIFRIATSFVLMEISNINNDLLKSMLLRAPGSYHHSVLVSYLSENAASQIGADALLARAGGLYHDIGKLDNPEYFIENQSGENKHTSINPWLSKSIIMSHVSNGVKKAKMYKLPKRLIDIISQHHGTTTLEYFLKEARENNAFNGKDVDIEEFRYSGPSPNSKEAAIVMLADGIEAAARANPGKSEKTLRVIVNSIIEKRIYEGELNSSNLTLTEIDMIREAFIAILMSIYHKRIQYGDTVSSTRATENDKPIKTKTKSQQKKSMVKNVKKSKKSKKNRNHKPSNKSLLTKKKSTKKKTNPKPKNEINNEY